MSMNLEQIVSNAIKSSESGLRIVQLQKEYSELSKLDNLSASELISRQENLIERFEELGYGEMPSLQEYRDNVSSSRHLYFDNELSVNNLRAGQQELKDMLQHLIQSERAKVTETVQENLAQSLEGKSDLTQLATLNFDYFKNKEVVDNTELLDSYVQKEVVRQAENTLENENSATLGR